MFRIAEKYPINTSKTIFRVSIEAPLIARSAKPGQFAIFRLDEYGERFPLTIAGPLYRRLYAGPRRGRAL